MKVFSKIQKEKYKKVKIAKKLLEAKPESDKDDFVSWFGDFVDTFGGSRPENYNKWFDMVEENHVQIRRLLGGVKKHFVVKITDKVADADEDACEPMVNAITKNLPYYLSDYGMVKADLLKPMISGIKTSKHISYYLASRRPGVKEKKEVETAIAKLGEEWAKSKTVEQEITCTITTDPKAFCLLGHYGPDNCSCFRQTAGNARHKYNLGAISNTFVVLFRSGNIVVDEPQNSKNTLARMWGFYNPKDDVLNFCNYYKDRDLTDGNAIEALRQVCADMLEVDEKKIKRADQMIRKGVGVEVWLNSNAVQNWSFYESDKSMDYQYLNPAGESLSDLYYIR